MKLNKKLIMSCAALAACATTLVSSTYAWYTTNTEVTLDTVTGSTAAAADNSSLFISNAVTYDGTTAATWSSFGASATPVYTGSSIVLSPVENVDNTEFKPWVGAEGSTVTLGTDSTANYLEFVLRFRTDKVSAEAPVNVYVTKFTYAHSGDTAGQASLVSQETGGVGAGVYWADLIKSTQMAVYVSDIEADASGEYPADGVARGDADDVTVYDLSAFASANDINITDADAVAYFNAVTGNSITAPTGYGSDIVAATKSSASSNPLFVMTTNVVEVRFVFYLDGWDAYCFDIMRGQTLSIDMEFSTVAPTGDAGLGA